MLNKAPCSPFWSIGRHGCGIVELMQDELESVTYITISMEKVLLSIPLQAPRSADLVVALLIEYLSNVMACQSHFLEAVIRKVSTCFLMAIDRDPKEPSLSPTLFS